MAQRKWQTELADQFEGGVSTEKGMLDIQRGVMQNLYHEAIGLWASATPKNLTGNLSFTKTGIVAFDRVKNLPWKDYKPVAKGEAVIEPHVGNVDTIQIPINRMWYNSIELMDTDLARMKNEPVYRAMLTSSIAKTLAATLDAELFSLLIAAAAGKKDATIEIDIPKQFDPKKIDLYFDIADVVTEIEKLINAYYIGINRSQIVMIVDPWLYTRLIRGLTGAQMVVESQVLSWIQNERIEASKVSGIYIIRHPFLDNNVIEAATNEFHGGYNFKGYRALVYHVAAPWIVQVFNSMNGVVNKDTGNYRMIQRLISGKGLLYGDLIRVIKDPSYPGKEPLPFEEQLIAKKDWYNSNFGFSDWNIKIPESTEELRENYRKGDGYKVPDKDPSERLPKGWKQYTYKDSEFIWSGKELEVNGVYYRRAGEDWANKEGGLIDLKNWFEFLKEFDERKHERIRYEKLVLFTTTDRLNFKYAVPVYWELKK